MEDEKKCCGAEDKETRKECCQIEAIISVDERGQMVLPKEFREKAGIKAGDKFALTSFEKEGMVCCMVLVRADNLGKMVKIMMGPIVGEA